MGSQNGNGAVDAQLAALLSAVDEDRAFLAAQLQDGNSGLSLAKALRERDLSRASA